MIEGQTGVRSLRFGPGAIDGIGKELGRFIVTTMDVPWQRAQQRLGNPVSFQSLAGQADSRVGGLQGSDSVFNHPGSDPPENPVSFQ